MGTRTIRTMMNTTTTESDYSYKVRIGKDDDGTFWYQAFYKDSQFGYSDGFKTEQDAKEWATKACRSERSYRKSTKRSRYPKEFFPFK